MLSVLFVTLASIMLMNECIMILLHHDIFANVVGGSSNEMEMSLLQIETYACGTVHELQNLQSSTGENIMIFRCKFCHMEWELTTFQQIDGIQSVQCPAAKQFQNHVLKAVMN